MIQFVSGNIEQATELMLFNSAKYVQKHRSNTNTPIWYFSNTNTNICVFEYKYK